MDPVLIKKGMFYVKRINGNVDALFCTEEDVPLESTSFRLHTLALCLGNITMPYLGMMTEMMEAGPNGPEVTYTPAGDEDLRSICIGLMNSIKPERMSLGGWMRKVKNSLRRHIDDHEMDRLCGLVIDYMD